MDSILYALRRKDTGEFHRRVRLPRFCNWDVADPRRSNWTPDLGKATYYPLKGIRSLLGRYRNSHFCLNGKVEVEAVRIKVAMEVDQVEVI
jgi:hypothetical protein